MTSQAEHLSLMAFLFSSLLCNYFTCSIKVVLCYKQNLPIVLQNQSRYTRSIGFFTRSSEVNQIRRSTFLSSSLLPALCVRNVGKTYPTAMPLFHVNLVYMRLYIVQQFTIFTENVQKASLFLSETSLYKLFRCCYLIQNVRYSKDLRIAGYLLTARESCDGLCLPSENFAKAVRAREVRPDVMVLHSSLSNCRHF